MFSRTRKSQDNSHYHHRYHNDEHHSNHHDYNHSSKNKQNQNNHPKESTRRRVMIHQTDPNAAASILNSGVMKPGASGALGGAIYFCKVMDGCDMRACHRGTYLMADVYLGKTVANQSFDSGNSGFDAVVSGDKLPMYVVKDSNRVLNIRYLDGIIPPNTDVNKITMRDRMPLVYAATAQDAANIIKTQKIPFENRPEIAGRGIYLWQNIPDAKKFQKNGAETFLIAEVYFNDSCYEKSGLPNDYDLHKFETFRGDYEGTHYFMIKNPTRIERIHFVGGTRPPNANV